MKGDGEFDYEFGKFDYELTEAEYDAGT